MTTRRRRAVLAASGLVILSALALSGPRTPTRDASRESAPGRREPVDPVALGIERATAHARGAAGAARPDVALRESISGDPARPIRRLEAVSASGGILGVREMAAGEVLLAFAPGRGERETREWLEARGLAVIRRGRLSGLWRVRLPAGDAVEAAIARFSGEPGVSIAEPNYVVRTMTVPNDPRFGELWGMKRIQADLAWDLGRGSRTVVVGVIDTGVDYTHPDLKANLWKNPGETPGNGKDDDGNGFVDDVYGYDFFNDDPDPRDDHDHGTHVAGTIGAAGNNGSGVAGVNWSVSIMALKFLSAEGWGYVSDATECVRYATKMKARLTSNSWGGGGYSAALEGAIRDADAAGVLFVAAAGNGYRNNDVYPTYPGSYPVPNVIAVAASDSGDCRAEFSNWSPTRVHLAAPGVSILSTVRSGGYASFSGTSMATPHVSGALALLFAQAPATGHREARARLLDSVDRSDHWASLVSSGGRLNALRILQGLGTNDPPSARISASPVSGPAPLAVSFDGSGSTDPDGSIAAYAWDFGDGGTGSGVAASRTYSTKGIYTAALTVADASGAKARATVRIYVGVAPPPEEPSAADWDRALFVGLYDGRTRAFRNTGTSAPVWSPWDGWDLPDIGGNAAPALGEISGSGHPEVTLGERSSKTFFYGTICGGWYPVPLQFGQAGLGAYDASPALGDLDGDGDLDLMLGLSNGRTYGYRNYSPAGYWPSWWEVWEWDLPRWDVRPTISTASPSLGDLDGDGDLDLLMGEASGRCQAWRNAGTPAVPVWQASPAWNVPDVGTRSSPALRDLDGDGDLDLLVGRGSGSCAAFRNAGSKTAPIWRAEPAWDVPDLGTNAKPSFLAGP